MNEPQKMQIKLPDNIAGGVYSNAMQITHTREEFVLDFLSAFPPAGVAVARVILSPGHLKRMIAALQENLKRYETQFGKVQEAKDPGAVGFRAE